MGKSMTVSSHPVPHSPQKHPAPPPRPPHKPHHTPPHPAHRHAKDHGALVSALLCGAALAAGLAWYWLAPPAESGGSAAETLLTQMQDAANGTVAGSHAFGGGLNVVEKDGHIMVVAHGLPTQACVQVGWRLSKLGVIIVNGVLPQRLSAAKLAELCGMMDGGAALTWVPDPARTTVTTPSNVGANGS